MGKALGIVLMALSALAYSCTGQPAGRGTRLVTDMLGREVYVPDSIERIVCVRPSALRIIVYAGGAPLVSGVEENETRAGEYLHIIANPYLAELPVVGPMMGGDPELLAANAPDVIFSASTTAAEADELQKKTGIPVIALDHGDMGRRRGRLLEAIKTAAGVLGTESRADSLAAYINLSVSELAEKGRGIPENEKPRVYVGGISYRGTRGIVSTDPYYAAFEATSTPNAASGIDPRTVSPVSGTFIDPEQLLEWDPEYLFFDVGGLPLIRNDLRNPAMRNLGAYRAGRMFALMPYNNYHSNFELMLLNAWYAASVLYPEHFADTDIEARASEILAAFVGKDIYSDLSQIWGGFRRLDTEDF